MALYTLKVCIRVHIHNSIVYIHVYSVCVSLSSVIAVRSHLLKPPTSSSIVEFLSYFLPFFFFSNVRERKRGREKQMERGETGELIEVDGSDDPKKSKGQQFIYQRSSLLIHSRIWSTILYMRYSLYLLHFFFFPSSSSTSYTFRSYSKGVCFFILPSA